jgi:hypothetical protein
MSATSKLTVNSPHTGAIFFSKHFHNAIWPGITARLCRWFFAVYAYQYFGKSFFMEGNSQSSLIGFASWMLGHAGLTSNSLPKFSYPTSCQAQAVSARERA